MRNMQLTPFSWGNIDLAEVMHIAGVPHPTKPAIGTWLEYADPRAGVNKILERNPYIEAHSVDVKLRSTDDKDYDTKVYHPIGFLLIVMESGQPRAQVMKAAVAAFVWHYAGPPQMTFKQRTELLKHVRNLLNDLAKCKDAFVQAAQIAHLIDLYIVLGQPLPDIALLGKDPNQLALPGV